MIVLPVVLMVVGFVVGLRLASRFAPPLADTRTGRVSASVVDLLVGLAFAVFALDLYSAVYVIVDGPGGAIEADALARELSEVLWSTGMLLGVAAAVHLLAPPPDLDDDV